MNVVNFFSIIHSVVTGTVGLAIIGTIAWEIFSNLLIYDVIQVGQNLEPILRARGCEICVEDDGGSYYRGTILMGLFFTDNS